MDYEYRSTTLNTQSSTEGIPAQTLPPWPFSGTSINYDFRVFLQDQKRSHELHEPVRYSLSLIHQEAPGLTNAQLYDELYLQLCGFEPLEQPALLSFAKLSAAAILNLLSEIVEREINKPKDHSVKPETEITASLETLGESQTCSLKWAYIFPSEAAQILRRLKSLQAVDLQAWEVYELFYFLGCSKTEVSRITGTDSETVDRRLSRAFVHLKEW